jgi:hypothetical protein
MGCGGSKAASQVNEHEVTRKGVPARIEVPFGSGGWRACTIGKQIGEIPSLAATAYELRVDNGGSTLRMVLKKPDALNTFASFTEYMGEDDMGDEDAYENFKKMLPMQGGQPISCMILGDDSRTFFDGRVCENRQYNGGERLLVLIDDRLVDATVAAPPLNSGSMHTLTIESSTHHKPRSVTFDLNEFNHCQQLFTSALEYEEMRMKYLQQLVDRLAFVEDAITGNRLNIDDQLVYITCAVDAKQGSGTWASIGNMEGLSEHLLAPSPLRSQGTHEATGVLMRAGPGTGKTVSLQQLTRLVAKRLLAQAATPPAAASTSRKPAHVDPNTPAGPGIGLVPMLLSVQRLASYMKQRGGMGVDGADLLRAYIDTEYSGAERDLLAQAYQMRALICCIDGVDEAAGLKTRIEELVTKQLAPSCVRTVVSSRPEGVRLERYSDWVVMNLSPLSDEQQHAAISAQLKKSEMYEHLSVLSKVRRGVPKEATAATIAEQLKTSCAPNYEALVTHVKGSMPEDTNIEEAVDAALGLFEEASVVPVMLSMLVLILEMLTASTALPTSRFELYKSSVRASVKRKFPDDKESINAGRMLAMIAIANHIAQRREFNSSDVEKALSSSPEALALWKQLDSSPGSTHTSGVPLIKILEVGSQGGAGHEAGGQEASSKYQFTHLSFQESFFAEALLRSSQPPGDAATDLLTTDLGAAAMVVFQRGSHKLLNDRWLLNTFTICGGSLGRMVGDHLGSGLTELRLTQHQVKSMVALEWEPLRGRNSLTRLVLNIGQDVDFKANTSPGVWKLAALLADKNELPALTCLEMGSPVFVGVDAAMHISAASAHRRGLRLYETVSSAQLQSLGDADAVLIAATLRNCVGSDVWGDEIPKVVAGTSGPRIGIGSGTLAEALKAAGIEASSFPKELVSSLLFSGYSASDLRSGLRLSTEELGDAGFNAADIAVTLESGTPSSSTLKELADNSLALELVCSSTNGLGLEDLRKAGCAGIPTDDDMEGALEKVGMSFETLKNEVTFTVASKSVKDAEGEAMVWAIALHCGEGLKEINFSTNEVGVRTAAAIAQLLRFNQTLKTVDLHENALEDAGLIKLAKALTHNGFLETLRVSRNEVTAAGATAIYNGVTKNCALKHLTLELSGGTLNPGIAIPALKGLVPAENIDMQSRNYGPLSALVICRLIDNYRPQVTQFALDKNAILAEGAVEVAEMLKKNDDIKLLDLRFCALGPEGMIVVCEALKVNTSVEKFLCLTNHLGPDGAKALLDLLQHNTNLKHINVEDNLFPPQFKKQLHEAASEAAIEIVL